MDLLREYFWLWIIIGMIFVSVVIGLTFYFINRWISKKAEVFRTNSPDHPSNSPEFYVQNNSYHPRDIENDLPPLPPRTQFKTCPEADCYENLAEPPDYVSLDDQIVPPPYIKNLSQECCYDKHSVSSEDYDDIGKNDCNEGRQSEEDYDDVG
ncbi:SLP adapter and CSK-interacting membrane protein-like [Hypomesus transpacificus]|uniref:SLP adapter and CSK-interacting membrane protein-like n=1 Tax=Hypomesus transpacificus TaxID=137520 RepID=UPI001F084E36|nr:SLP adapter and CSK-interacting membrane protein-like [Hypomesus transpacificus]